jgi:FtsH-binding integral membrane protein
MRNEIFENQDQPQFTQATMAKTFMSNVFSYMTFALIVSGIAAFMFGNIESLEYMLRTENGITILGWVVMLAPLGLVFLLGAKAQKFSYTTVLGIFMIFALLIGMSLSSIFIMYTESSIVLTFMVTAGTFGVMAILGYTTSTDLTQFGSILKMALIGLIIAMVANMFMQSGPLDYLISGIGVLVFTGLTAYDTQKLKQIGSVVDANSEEGKKASIMGALSLYLDFINLFMFLLRFLGSRD